MSQRTSTIGRKHNKREYLYNKLLVDTITSSLLLIITYKTEEHYNEY